jgi:hypothetical protein
MNKFSGSTDGRMEKSNSRLIVFTVATEYPRARRKAKKAPALTPQYSLTFFRRFAFCISSKNPTYATPRTPPPANRRRRGGIRGMLCTIPYSVFFQTISLTLY